MKARDRAVAALTSGGFTAAEVGKKLGVSQRTIEGLRSRADVRELTEHYDEVGVGPAERLEILTYSSDEGIALRASVELAKLRAGGYAEPAASDVPDGALVVHPHALELAG